MSGKSFEIHSCLCLLNIEHASDDKPVRPYKFISSPQCSESFLSNKYYVDENPQTFTHKLSLDDRRDFFSHPKYKMFREKESCVLAEVELSRL